MSIQDDYNAAQGATDAHCADFLNSHKANYALLKAAGASPLKLAGYKFKYRLLQGAIKIVCEAANDAAATVPGVQVFSGGGPKDDPEIEPGP